MAETNKKEVPTQQEIDSLLGLYADAEKALGMAREVRDMYGDQVAAMIEQHGFMPPRATKSKRIQGAEWKATLSQGQSVEVDGTAAKQIRALLKKLGRVRFFRKLFRLEVVYVLAPGSQKELASLGFSEALSPSETRALVTLYNQAVEIKSKSPSLEVEPLKKKEGKAA